MKSRLLACSMTLAALLCSSVFAENKLSYEGYKLKFEDNFDGKKLNTKYWNYESHEVGWVNNELQSYGPSKKNTYVKDGNLVIQPIETVDAKGNRSYTSGRINTLGKFHAKYGIFEARLKVPEGQGYLPAFWMMPANESLYGQWPLCGEIDIMEVLGHETNKLYSTLHFGEPHTQKQVSTVIDGDFSKEFHKFTLVWNPDEFAYYVDDVYYGSITEWFTKKIGDDPVTFPAPYDQPYYMILNVAVGGTWPGDPDETTPFDERGQMVVDYVRVYQKDSYDENVKPREMKVDVRSGDASGNLVRQDFNAWEFKTQLGGDGNAKYSKGTIEVETKNAGSVDYSVQLVQADIPLVKGGLYEFSFDAWSTENRSTLVGITGPNNGFVRYFGDEKIDLTTAKKNYKFKFQMTETTDPACRIDFNMGATNSTAPIYISNVKLIQTGMGKIAEAEKSVTADGNYIYNGTFDRGEGRMKYWTKSCKNNSSLEITNENNKRECLVKVGENESEAVVLSQDKIPLSKNTEYVLSIFSSSKGFEKTKIMLDDIEVKLEKPAKEGKPYKAVFTTKECGPESTLKLIFENKGEWIFDNVRLAEKALLMNGNFKKGLSGWQLYSYSSSDASAETSANGVEITINDTTDQEWKIQLKQNDVSLEKGATYILSFDIESTEPREIKYALQRDGTRWLALYGEEDWTPYNWAPTTKADSTKRHVENEFKMEYADDENVIMSFSMGTVNGNRITKEHKVTISNVSLIQKDVPVEAEITGWEM